VDESNAVHAAETRLAKTQDRVQRIRDGDREGWEIVTRATTHEVSDATAGSASEALIINPDVERAVAADEQRIAIELADTVIRDLFGVGLTLSSVLPHVTRLGEQPLNAAIDDIDRIIRTIRDVVFALEARTPPQRTLGPTACLPPRQTQLSPTPDNRRTASSDPDVARCRSAPAARTNSVATSIEVVD